MEGGGFLGRMRMSREKDCFTLLFHLLIFSLSSFVSCALERMSNSCFCGLWGFMPPPILRDAHVLTI